MSKDKIQKPDENFKEVESALTSAESFFENNSKIITTVFGVAVAIALILLLTHRFYSLPRESKAIEQIAGAQNYFQKDSFKLALNGDGNYPGFLDIIDDYGRTKAGKLARYYAGISYLHLGKYKEAIEYLEDFSTDDPLLKPVKVGATGDAYAELGNKEKALKLYLNAADESKNAFTTPVYYLKAGRLYESMGNKDKALEIYRMIKDKFPMSTEGQMVDKYISRITAKS